MKRLSLLLFLALPVLAADEALIRHDANAMPWKAAPPTLPAGAQIAVLEGDPKGTGLFTMRVKLPAGARLAPHWHPNVERVTVISGAVGIGYGERFDTAQLRVFESGSYYVTPPQMRHYASFAEETVLQVTTIGPWELHPVVKP